MLWFTLVFLVALKIPIVYLCWVVWWAIKDPPQPGEGAEGAVGEADSGGPGSGSWWRPPMPGRRPRRGPHGSPTRKPQPAVARSNSRIEA
jgi:hypothetical protein